MHYVTHRSHKMQNHKFSITCFVVLCMETVSGPPKHGKIVHDVARAGRAGMHYVARRSHRMQKQKFGVTCPDVLFWKLHSTHPSKKNSASMF
jgi:hypothetical protein